LACSLFSEIGFFGSTEPFLNETAWASVSDHLADGLKSTTQGWMAQTGKFSEGEKNSRLANNNGPGSSILR
jgi:hypothetical protein